MNEFIIKVKGVLVEIEIEDKSGPSHSGKKSLINQAVTACIKADGELRRQVHERLHK